MKILLYVPNLSQDSGGTRQYALGLLKVLEKDLSNQYFILTNNLDQELLNIIESSKRLDFVLINRSISLESKFERFLFNITRFINFVLIRAQKKFRVSYYSYLNRIVRKYKIDIVHSPFQYTPYVNVRTICTMHDVQELHYPEYFSAFDRFVRSFNYMDCLDRASHVIVSYEHVKLDLQKYFNLSPDKISVVLLDFNDFWFSKFLNSNHEIVESLNESIPSKYILYPANTWPHKNHINLLNALTQINEIEINLVCTGGINDYYYDTIRPLIKSLGLEGRVHFVGIQNEKTLFSLYQNALFVVVPTKYEAGSFPLIEAIFIERPVICSNVTSLPDTIGDPEFQFNPNDVLAMSYLLRKMILDEEFRNKAKYNSKIQKQKLMYSNCMNNILSAYNLAVK
ncbi:glycosyltransferase family 1 protein [Sandaracinomonas limnophila]|uniref:Glycosyltransferase family 1 protein n=1 Tax=Sandaracinomonas limnophila TaxID=1862386 RepID=A0A437PTL5_9BACT|nr:glycosyltransferase family 1 protein [Sandaracinomonas limnophila]RVU25602.1 glycosyltransferase family 1 protein [Sandaracinomonas limnophila]